jgi:hypothetical protein
MNCGVTGKLKKSFGDLELSITEVKVTCCVVNSKSNLELVI